jgi:23S rRNA pseudouridine1911/1915/1917 synthase
MELLRHRVPADAKPTSVGRYLEGPLRLSGTLVRRLKMAGGIRLNGEVVRTPHPVVPGDEIVLTLVREDAPNVAPEAMDLAVVHEDADVVVVLKPAGVVVHPTAGVYAGTLANGLAHRWSSRGEPAAIHPVHRIDRETSGLVVFARHPLAHMRLAAQLEAHTLERSYLALVRGHLAQDVGVVDAPIALRGDHPTARAVRPEGQHAVTDYEVVERHNAPDLPPATLVRLRLRTGRTHQIRVHMAHLGHPLLGDDLYGAARGGLMPRQALHAETLGFKHPRSDEWTLFQAAWPEDLAPLRDAYLKWRM